MKKIVMWKREYGIMNLIIIMVCALSLIINAFTVNQDELLALNANKRLAFVLNFLLADKGMLISNGSLSYDAVFYKGQCWRVITNTYLHAGIFHMAFNMGALICVGRYIEKKIGSIVYILCFNIIAIIDAIIVCNIFPDEVSVGASAGIFGILGIAVAFFVIDRKSMNEMKKGELIFLIIFSGLSLLLGVSSFVHHFCAFVIGLLVGLAIYRLFFRSSVES